MNSLNRVLPPSLEWFWRLNIFYIKCNLNFSILNFRFHVKQYGVVNFPGGSVVKNPPALQESQKTQVPSLGQGDPLEEGLTTHSNILAWRIPWTEEAGGLESIESHSQTQVKRLSMHAHILFSIVAAPIYIFTNSVHLFPLFHICTNICYLLSFLIISLLIGM